MLKAIKYPIIIFLFFCVERLSAQNSKFTASISNSQVATGEQFEVTFSVNGNASNFNPPTFSDFQVLSGPNVSSSMTVINGNMSASTSYSFYLMAVKQGNFAIGSATVALNGKTLSSNLLQVRVVKGQPVNPTTSSTDNRPVAGSSENLSKSIFIKAVTNKTNVYQGEQLVVSYKLFTRVDISANELDKLPELNGFWSQDIKNLDQNTQWKTETFKGMQYHVADLKQTILFPEHSGNLTIDPLAMTLTVRQPVESEDVFEQFFGSFKEVRIKLKSSPLTIHVKPLPVSGKPTNFSGAVGKFSLDASVDKKELKANEALNYQLKIAGSGNIKLLSKLNTAFPKDFEKYDPKLTDSLTETVTGVSGNRIYTYLLIPRKKGDFAIDGITFSYFNPATGKYATLSAPIINIKVNKGDPSTNVTALVPADKQDVKELDKDIRFIKVGKADFYKEGKGFYGSVYYYLLLFFGPAAFISAFLFRKWNKKNNSDEAKIKCRKAGKIAAKHLSNAQSQLSADNSKAFYEAIFKGIYGYLSDKLNLPIADLSKEKITSELKARLVDDRLISDLMQTLDLCEMARYAPVASVSELEIMNKAKNLINNIESKL